ncbi:MAG: hypothetical protein WCO98_06720 [bacterium]
MSPKDAAYYLRTSLIFGAMKIIGDIGVLRDNGIETTASVY